MSKIDPDTHYESPDDTPVAIPARLQRPESLTEQIRRLIRQEASYFAANSGMETFEEADDFDIPDDDYDPRSPHELSLDQELEGYGSRDESSGGGKAERRGEGNLETEGSVQPRGEETPETPKGGNGTSSQVQKP